MTNFATFSSIVPAIVLWKPLLAPGLVDHFSNNPNGPIDENMLSSCQWVKVWQSPAMRGSNALFPVATFDSSKLCSGNMNLPVKVRLQT
jgi:hypothetical protein